MVVAEHRALADRGAKLVELRLDWLSKSPDLPRLIQDRPTPVVVTCRRPEDGGRWRGPEDQRLLLLRQAIVSGVEYVDLEQDVAGKIPRYGKTKRIVSHHDFRATPDNIEQIHAELCKLDPDIVKLVTTATSPTDNVRLLRLVSSADVPTIGFCMGEYGIVSRVLCGKYGSPFTYAAFSKDRVVAPGQITFDEMQNMYRFDAIDEETRVFGVLGDPIAHSLSPLLHNAAFQHEKLNCVYLPLRVPSDEFYDTFQAFGALDFQGYSVTIPHKEFALKLASYHDESVEEIGATNTLYQKIPGRWSATNTDYDAALASIRLGLAKTGNDSIEGRRVVMLGAGGVARAIGLGVVRAGGALTVTNRTQERGKKLAEDLECQFVAWENRGSAYADVLINCTPVGMSPNVDDSPFAQYWLRDGMVVFDTIYNPENTLLIKQAQERGCYTVSGSEMFVRQAAAQFECFVDRPAPLDVMLQTLRKGISAARH
jgi:3-dehydroquinate dehydratase/shikimate dehydrogenase